METVLERVKEQYDLVVIDTPPLTAVSDAFPLLGKVDGVVIVGRVGRNRHDVAQRLHETLSGAGAPLLGVIANGFKSGRLGSYGGYGYSYDYAQSNPEPPTGSGGETPPSPKGSPSSEGSSVSPGGATAPASPDGAATPAAASPNGAEAAEEAVPTSQG